jgi:hypothetical protein
MNVAARKAIPKHAAVFGAREKSLPALEILESAALAGDCVVSELSTTGLPDSFVRRNTARLKAIPPNKAHPTRVVLLKLVVGKATE